jgi:8-oxo-dGTP pyrophosphatase MutT (NUDIX family)
MPRGGTRQIAAIPVRPTPEGGIEVLLVTSRETQRWIVPKGWPMSGRRDHEAAAKEAWEEAGVVGKTRSSKLGVFTYDKRDRDRSTEIKVKAYILQVTEEREHWPEDGQRRREWFSPEDAADRVAEPGLKELLRRLGLSAANGNEK